MVCSIDGDISSVWREDPSSPFFLLSTEQDWSSQAGMPSPGRSHPWRKYQTATAISNSQKSFMVISFTMRIKVVVCRTSERDPTTAYIHLCIAVNYVTTLPHEPYPNFAVLTK